MSLITRIILLDHKPAGVGLVVIFTAFRFPLIFMDCTFAFFGNSLFEEQEFKSLVYTTSGGLPSFIDSILAFIGGTRFEGQNLELVATLMGIVYLICMVLSLAVCYGMWTFKTWGLSVAKVLYLIYLSLGIIDIIGVERTVDNLIGPLLFIIFAIFILYSLNNPEFKSQYHME